MTLDPSRPCPRGIPATSSIRPRRSREPSSQRLSKKWLRVGLPGFVVWNYKRSERAILQLADEPRPTACAGSGNRPAIRKEVPGSNTLARGEEHEQLPLFYFRRPLHFDGSPAS